MDIGTTVIVIVFFVAYLAVAVTALVQISRSQQISETTRVLWVLVVIIAPFLGSIAWFLIGRNRTDNHLS